MIIFINSDRRLLVVKSYSPDNAVLLSVILEIIAILLIPVPDISEAEQFHEVVAGEAHLYVKSDAQSPHHTHIIIVITNHSSINVEENGPARKSYSSFR